MRGTRALIHLENLAHNIREIKKTVGDGVALCLPVKANAYGHGAVPVAKKALECGVNYLAVATVDEGCELRSAGIDAPVLLFSIPDDTELDALVCSRLTPFVSDETFVRKLEKAAARVFKRNPQGGSPAVLSVHLKIETGMGRTGCAPSEAARLAAVIAACPSLRMEGVATHFSVSDSTEEDDVSFTRRQIDIFKCAVESVRSAGYDPGVVHAAASGGVLLYPDAYFSMVRPGILVYGYPPSNELKGRLDVKPVMELRSEILFVKECKKGTPVSYGRTWVSPHDCRIATVGAGYADGIRRDLSPGLCVEINGEACPVRGRVCMDQCMVEVSGTNTPVAGDPVTIFGPPPCACSAADLADRAGTIPYEITCAISARVPRVFLDGDGRGVNRIGG